MTAKMTPRGAFIVLEKELRLLFKSKRRIFLLVVIPLIILLMGIVAGFTTIGAIEESENIQIAVIDENPSNYTALLKSYWSSINGTDIVEISQSYRDFLETENLHVLAYIPSNFTTLLEAQNLSSVLIIYNTNSSLYQSVAFQMSSLTLILEDQLIRTQNPDVTFDLIAPQLKTIDGSELGLPPEIAELLLIIPVYIIFFIVIPPISLILISVTTEREQRTLEVLFSQPVRRRDIVLGKIYYGLSLVLITMILDILSAVIAALLFQRIVKFDSSGEFGNLIAEGLNTIGFEPILAFFLGMIGIAINVIALSVLLSLLAKDEREANMISGLIPILIFGILGFVFIVPVDELAISAQLIFASLPVMGVIIGIYLSTIAGKVIWIAYVSIATQFIWAFIIIFITAKVSEAESIIELTYGKAFKELRRVIFRR